MLISARSKFLVDRSDCLVRITCCIITKYSSPRYYSGELGASIPRQGGKDPLTYESYTIMCFIFYLFYLCIFCWIRFFQQLSPQTHLLVVGYYLHLKVIDKNSYLFFHWTGQRAVGIVCSVGLNCQPFILYSVQCSCVVNCSVCELSVSVALFR